MTQTAQAALVDWGTTRMRVWLVDASGAVLAERRSDDGMLSAQPDRFGPVLEAHLSDMGAPSGLPVIACGMVGARQGWIEAPYVEVPARLEDIFDGAVSVPHKPREVRILPGIAQRTKGLPDVMRGEETQLAGAADKLASGECLVCMPGTHSKWVATRDGRVSGFRTHMTGELFALLSGQSILRHSVGVAKADPASDAFLSACDEVMAKGGAALPRLFGIRAGTLLNAIGPEESASRLSGLLIGAEIAQAINDGGGANGVVLVASGGMKALYEGALSRANLTIDTVDADAAVLAGLATAARHYGILPTRE